MNQIDPSRVLHYLHEEGKKSEIVRLAVDASVKSAFIDQQAQTIELMEKQIAENEKKAEKPKLKEVKNEPGPSPKSSDASS